MTTIVGIAGAHRHACAAVWRNDRFDGVCEVERVTRERRVGLTPGRLPRETLDALDVNLADGIQYVVAEPDIVLPPSVPLVRLDHHAAHAAAAFLPSPFQRAAILVCDHHSSPELSVWRGDGARIARHDWPSASPGFARLYSACARLLGFESDGREQRLEALARIGTGLERDRLHPLWQYADGEMRVRSAWEDGVAAWRDRAPRSTSHLAEVASAIQGHLGSLLLQLIGDVRASIDCDALCLCGGLFSNTYFNTLVRRSGLFSRVFVPINPGNAGLAAGAALAIADLPADADARVSPFLGPEFDDESIKSALDNCKLTYEFVTGRRAIDAAVDALRRGGLVGWFQGRMEWGPRALGHRSILADPRSTHVLENVNVYLKGRDRYRACGLSVLKEDVDRYFDGPADSPYMEHEFGVRDPELLRAVIPKGASALRVQTVDASPGLFRELHRAYADATGAGVLVNTSFNGYREPIVCTPRDAVRAFYGTGLDLLVIGRFLLRK